MSFHTFRLHVDAEAQSVAYHFVMQQAPEFNPHARLIAVGHGRPHIKELYKKHVNFRVRRNP